MAANEAIIRAAGQRWAPIKTDYSGYIQGLSSIATGLIEIRKRKEKTAQSYYDLVGKSLKSKTISPYKDYIKHTTYDMIKDGNDPTALLEGVNSDLDNYDELMDIIRDPNIKFSIGANPLLVNYLETLGDEEFENSISITQKDENGKDIVTELDISTWLDPEDNRFKMLDIDGEGYIPVSEVLAMAKNAVRITDGIEVKQTVTNFAKSNLGNEDKFVSQRGAARDNMKDLFKFGVLNNKGEVQVSPHRVKRSAMIDQEYQIRTDMNGRVFGEKGFDEEKGTKEVDVTFYDWYLDESRMKGDQSIYVKKMPNEFIEQWNKYIEMENPSGEKYEEMKKMLVASMIEEDDDVEADFLEFYESVLNTYRAKGVIEF